MLDTLTIKNLALIEDLHIDFREGLTILSGETGAGKSIILGALNLLLGDKADSSFVRSGSQEASVTATVNIGVDHPLHMWLQERSLQGDDGSVIIHRLIRSSGRGGTYVQGTPVALSDVKFISSSLFDIHGQHEHQSLLHKDRQRNVLDRYASLEETHASFLLLYKELQQINKEEKELGETLLRAQQEGDYLQFVADELFKAQLKKDEESALEQEISLLSEFEAVQDSLDAAQIALKGAVQEGAISQLTTALHHMNKIGGVDPLFEQMGQRLESSLIEIQDLSESIRDKLSSLNYSDQRLDELQSRLALIQRLKRKYGPTVEAVIEYYEKTLAKLETFEKGDEQLLLLQKRKAKTVEAVEQAAHLLTEKRTQAAKNLEVPIAHILATLGMPHVGFSISIDKQEMNSTGGDNIEFLFSANLGEPLKPLKEIASGGELSRVMLAIKSVLADSDDIETLVFDEVDAGIGGSVAKAVGDQMASLAKKRQVIVITHLASIASQADNHLVVQKVTKEGRTFTLLEEVKEEERIKELARMLSGTTVDEKALEHARSLINSSQRS
ncbi:MAG: DNA repair protein RecN [Sphaerochaetaceae bacterium]|jgi:DNA repair protein RecN (Recombination protein N)